MAEHEPIDEPESRFLEHERDLMALKKKAYSPIIPTTPASPPNPRQEKILLIAALLIPPITISLVPGILAKMVIMAILAFTGFVILESQPGTTASPFVGERKEKANYANTDVRRREPNQEQCTTLLSFPEIFPSINMIELTLSQALTRARPKERHENV